MAQIAIGGNMIFLFMIIFIFFGHEYGMQSEVDVIDQDYAVLVPYVLQMFKKLKDDFSPFKLLDSLAKPEAYINFSVTCNYLSPSDHIAQIIQKQRIRMSCDYEIQQQKCAGDKDQLYAWFTAYFQVVIADRMKLLLKQERDQKKLHEQHSSIGI